MATLGTLIGVALGVTAAARHGGIIDQIPCVVARVGYLMPIFWLGLMGCGSSTAFSAGWDGRGVRGLVYDGMVPTVTRLILVDTLIAGDWGTFRGGFSPIILPASLLGYFGLAYISRVTRSFMLKQLSAECITTAASRACRNAR